MWYHGWRYKYHLDVGWQQRCYCIVSRNGACRLDQLAFPWALAYKRKTDNLKRQKGKYLILKLSSCNFVLRDVMSSLHQFIEDHGTPKCLKSKIFQAIFAGTGKPLSCLLHHFQDLWPFWNDGALITFHLTVKPSCNQLLLQKGQKTVVTGIILQLSSTDHFSLLYNQ